MMTNYFGTSLVGPTFSTMQYYIIYDCIIPTRHVIYLIAAFSFFCTKYRSTIVHSAAIPAKDYKHVASSSTKLAVDGSWNAQIQGVHANIAGITVLHS
jgi:hypothetical protein